jgi:aldose 1-epimerase
LFVNAGRILETIENIPTGRFVDLKNHPFDFQTPKKCPQSIDTTFVLPQNVQPVASLSSSKNQLRMKVFTDQPAVHIYIGGNCFNILEGKEKAQYHPWSGICFETQHFPDAPNQPHFPTAILKKGDNYTQRTIYKFEMM